MNNTLIRIIAIRSRVIINCYQGLSNRPRPFPMFLRRPKSTAALLDIPLFGRAETASNPHAEGFCHIPTPSYATAWASTSNKLLFLGGWSPWLMFTIPRESPATVRSQSWPKSIRACTGTGAVQRSRKSCSRIFGFLL